MDSANIVAVVVMFGWLPLVLVAFAWLPPSRAVIVAFVAGWLLLPMAQFHLNGVPAYSYSKMAAISGGVLLAMLLLDSGTLMASWTVPSLVDVPIIVWCLCPMMTAVANMPDLTIRDGAAWTFTTMLEWGLPYFIGRIYLGNFKWMRELAIAIFIGGLVYVPLCIYEMKFSPILHMQVYGFAQNSIAQQIRLGGWRPMVFLPHGIAVGLFMSAASLAGLWLWYSGSLTRLAGVPMPFYLAILWITTVFCRSTGSLMLLAAGTAAIFAARWLRTRVLVMALILLPSAYVASRTVFHWNGDGIKDVTRGYVASQRQESLTYRFDNEKMIVDRSMKRPLFGWGGYARAYPLDAWGHTRWVPDSLWIITFGTYGAVGLVTLLLMMAPVAILLLRMKGAAWRSPEAAGAVAMCIILFLFAIDNLLNAMPNPIFVLGLGGLSGLLVAPRREIHLTPQPPVGYRRWTRPTDPRRGLPPYGAMAR